MKRFYVAGPMSEFQDTDWNFRAFARATLYLRSLGHTVINPAEVDAAVWGFNGLTDRSLPALMTRIRVLAIDLGILLPTCDAIYLLKGWSRSSGACAEVAAAMTYGLEIVYEAGAERGTVGFIAEGEQNAA